MATVTAGSRVQIGYTLLKPEERAPGLPADTAQVPYDVKVRGILQRPAAIGDRVTVTTATGRQLAGVLTVVDPADTHTFGRPVAALVQTMESIAATVRERR